MDPSSQSMGRSTMPFAEPQRPLYGSKVVREGMPAVLKILSLRIIGGVCARSERGTEKLVGRTKREGDNAKVFSCSGAKNMVWIPLFAFCSSPNAKIRKKVLKYYYAKIN